MKARILPFIFAIVFSCCSGGGSDDGPTSAGGTWKLGNFQYTAGIVNRMENSGIVVIVVTTDQDASNGAASGSALTLTFNDLGSGRYTIVDSIVAQENQDMRTIQVSCTIGTASQNSTRYDTTEASIGSANISLENGIYNVSIAEGVTVFKTIEVGNGVADTENSYRLTVNGI